MKKTCNKCRALQLSQGEGYSCKLGYKLDSTKGIPKEECPKPLTINKAIFLAFEQSRKRGIN